MKRSAVDVVVVVVVAAVVDVAVVKMEASKLDYDGDRSEEKKKSLTVCLSLRIFWIQFDKI